MQELPSDRPGYKQRFADCKCVWNPEEFGPEDLADKPPVDSGRSLSKGIDWFPWGQLKAILEITREEFQSQAGKGFVDASFSIRITKLGKQNVSEPRENS